MRSARGGFAEGVGAIAVVLLPAVLMWLVLAEIGGTNGWEKWETWVGRVLWGAGWLWGLVAGVVAEIGRRRGLRVEAFAAVRRAFGCLPMIAPGVLVTVWVLNTALALPWPYKGILPVLAAVAARVLLVVPVLAVGLDEFWRYAEDRVVYVVGWVGCGVVVPYLAVEQIGEPVFAAVAALVAVPLQAFVLAKVFVELTEDFAHTDEVIGQLTGPGHRPPQ